MPRKTSGFDVEAFIKGVKRPTRTVSLCTDAEVAERVDVLSVEIGQLVGRDDESLGGDPRLDDARAELAALEQDDANWTDFVIQAPTHQNKIHYMSALAQVRATEGEQDAGDDTDARSGLLEAEAGLISDCLLSINGEKVSISDESARHILTDWPDSLTRELIDAINKLAGPVVTAPFSRRSSANRTTPEP